MNSMFCCYNQIMRYTGDIMKIGLTVPLPRFEEEQIAELLQDAMGQLSRSRPVVRTSGEYVVVGDLHGSIHDLLRIFSVNGYPPEVRYLFLGDYVDRGEFSLEVIVFLLILYMKFPNHVILLRGNHEFPLVNKSYGFRNSIVNEYGSDRLWTMFNECFNYFPIGCIIDDEVICLHGGISSRFSDIKQLEELQFPITEDNALVSDIVWSDPSNATSTYVPNIRGRGQGFGSVAFASFLHNSNLKIMIRGHECVNGVHTNFNAKLITVFSASNYNQKHPNTSGYLIYKSPKEIFSHTLPVLPRIPKKDLKFLTIKYISNTFCTIIKLRKLKKNMHTSNSDSKMKSLTFFFPSKQIVKPFIPVHDKL